MLSILGVLLLCIFLMWAENGVQAQCAMCKGATEGSVQEGSEIATRINTGVLYLLIFPYMAVGIIGYLWHKKQKELRAKSD